MTIPAPLLDRMGSWAGENRLWLDPSEPCQVSEGSADVEAAVRGTALLLRYAWAFEGASQEGLLVLGVDSEGGVQASWTDSWHLAEALMACRGTVDADGTVSVLGSYAAPPGPDWGWRIALGTAGADRLVLRMFNVTPEGEETLAVEADYRRRPG